VANNGIVHVLGKVLIPPRVNIPTATTTDPETNPPVPTDPSMATLVNVVSELSNLSSLAQAIVAIGDMNDVLSGAAGPYTLYAPIDAAFDMFPTVQDVYMSDSSAWILHLQEVLKFHVTKTMITTDDLNNNNANDELMIPMLNGENVMMTTTRNRDNAILLSPAVMGTATISGVEMSAINGKYDVCVCV
jgi:uncharacterized surface protein with fasciclin (FAS1) repeats